MLGISESFLQDWQAGFREARGCRDNSMILRVLCDKLISIGKSLAVVFVDYSAAFDSVSHKFVDNALKEAGASPKVRAMCRAIYQAASAFTTVKGADRKNIKCEKFKIGRGVLQGDVTSPLYFIMALELILRRHDPVKTGQGASLADILIRLLGYADDVAVLEMGDEVGIQRIESRVTEITEGSEKDADMQVNIEKTKALHVRTQDKTTPTSRAEAMAVCKFRCPHLNCGFQFVSKRGMKIHAGRCEWRNEYEVEAIVGHRGPTVVRQYLIRWKCYDSEYDTFEPRSNVHPDLIKEYELDKGVYIHDWRFRCDVCDLPCSSARGVAIHKARIHKPDKMQNFAGTLTDGAAMMCKIVDQQASRPVVHCRDTPLDNVFREKYMGTVFTADADQNHDVKEKIARALARCGKLRHVLDSSDLSLAIKLRLYQAAVCSILSYGCETWNLNPIILKMINGANSRMLARFTGKTIPQEARQVSCSFDLVRHIRIRRFKWLGHILRAGPSRLTYQAVEEQHMPPHTHHTCLMDLTILARDRSAWRALARKI